MGRGFFCFLTMALLLAPSIQAADRKGQAEIAFAEGLVAYQQQKYATAAGHFSDALQWQKTHTQAAYFLGLSHFQQKQYYQAKTAFDQAVQLEDDIPEPYFYRGVIAYRQGRKEAAKADLNRALALKPKGEIKDIARSYLRSMERDAAAVHAAPSEKPEKRWFVNGRLTTGFDSNVSLNPENVTVATLPTDQNDFAFSVRAGGGYHLVDEKGMRVTPETFYYQSIYPDHGGLNYGLIHAGVNNRFRFGKIGLGMPLAYEYSRLGSKKYLSSIQLEPFVGVWAGRFFTQLTAKTKHNNFLQRVANAAQNRDAWNLQWELAETLFLDDQNHRLKITYGFEQNASKGADWDYDAHRFGWEMVLPFFWEIDLNPHLDLILQKDFAHTDSVLGAKRSDLLTNAGLRLSKQWMKHLETMIHYDFYDSESNLAFFTYERHIVGVTVATRF